MVGIVDVKERDLGHDPQFRLYSRLQRTTPIQELVKYLLSGDIE